MANLISLSPELIVMVAEGLTESEDLCNFRQSCAYVGHCSKPYYLRRFFSTRRHMFSRYSLGALSDIVSNDCFGPLLHTLVLGTDHLTTDPPLDDPVPFERQMNASAIRKELNINTIKYHTYLADQNNILSAGLAAAYLSSIFSKAINCKTLIIDDYHRAWGANFLKRETGVYPTTDLDQLDSQDFIVSAFETILIALTASGLRIQTLEIYAGCTEMPINPEILSPRPLLQLSGLPCSTSLTTLMLAVESGHNYALDPESWPRILTQFILQFPHLEMLALAFEPRAGSKALHHISHTLSLPRLQTLVLSSVDCTEGDLTRLFQNHQTTLQDISLDTINIVCKGGSWHSLLTSIRDQVPPRRLSIENCFQDDEDIIVQGNEMIPSSISIQVPGDHRPWGPL